MHARRALTAMLLLNLIMAGLALTTPQAVGAAPTRVVVTPSTLTAAGWLVQHDNCNAPDDPSTGSTAFVTGPNTPPLGAGSVQFSTGTSGTAYEGVRNGNYDGVKLSTITSLRYSTIVTSGTLTDVPYLSLGVEYTENSTTAFEALSFEPAYQNGSYPQPGPTTPAQNGGTIQANTWQTWDVVAGAIRRVAAGDQVPTTTLAQFAAAHPDAVIRNTEAGRGVRIFAGCGGNSANLVAGTDNVTVGVSNIETTFDFEQDKDLAISKAATPNPVTAGSAVNYTITVINSGPGTALDTVVTDTLPSGAAYFSCTASNGGVCGGSGNNRTITFASLPSGTAATIFLTATVATSVPGGTSLVNTASVATYGPELNVANNAATAAVTVSNPTPPATPAPTTYTVEASATGPGTIAPTGTSTYISGNQASYTATSTGNAVFLGWTLDGQYVGYASPLTFKVETNRTLIATFAARPAFADVPTSDPDYQAITFLAAAGIINPGGVNGSGRFEPERDVKRAEMAAFVARTFGWDKEFHRNTFPDKCDQNAQNCIDDELWNNVAALADYGVVGGYTDPATCASAGTTSPCYLPRDVVQRVQVASIVARSFIKTPDLRPTGFWDRQAANNAQYTNVGTAGTQRSDLTTYRTNAGPIPGQANDTTFPNPEGNGSRRFIIQVLYQAFNAQFSVDRVP